MTRFIVAAVSCLLLIVCLSQQLPAYKKTEDYHTVYRTADKLYQDAERLSGSPGFTDEQEEAMNKKALEEFRRIPLLIAQGNNHNDSLLFFCYLKTGILEHYFGNTEEAKKLYTDCIKIKNAATEIADSFLFKPYLYSGILYYLQDNFDSSLLFFKKAEQIVQAYPARLNETERLYNSFGSIYLSTGNYRQAKNYFEKALQVLPASHPYYSALLVNYKINIAGSLVQLEEYEKADSIYQEILPYKINENEILHNEGQISLYTGKYEQAIRYFHRVKYEEANSISLYNSIATAYYKTGNTDSSLFYLQKAIAVNKQFYADKKNSDYGSSMKLMGDISLHKKEPGQAIAFYQQAIKQFDPSFNNTDISSNPGQYSGVFFYTGLLNALIAKGQAFTAQYDSSHKPVDLIDALNAYQSAYSLFDYVEKTYDSDEARLFLNKVKYNIRTAPVDLCFRLYSLTGNDKYKEQAYLFDQRNKATVLTLNVQENLLRTNNNPLPILARQSAIRSSITRFSLKARENPDTGQVKQFSAIIRDYEIELSKIQDTINNDPSLSRLRFAEKIPSLNELRKKIKNDNTAILSYHISSDKLYGICITQDSLQLVQQNIDSIFFNRLLDFNRSLRSVNGERKYEGSAFSALLYKMLVAPFKSTIKELQRLVIIPEEELNYLPFEALQDQEGNYLLRSFAIQYQYSTALLGPGDNERTFNSPVLGMAPFASAGYIDSSGQTVFERLRKSGEELPTGKAKKLLDSSATKLFFLQNAAQYGIIHLATHAVINEQSPDLSSIAFYPSSGDNILFAGEIYNLRLDSTRLIILSACETGSGQLIRGEGMMSLSRAFTYAGCRNMISSLWKAEDITTSFILQRVYNYLDKGYTRDKALQQAKIDLLNSDKIEDRFKTPNYWAHLVLIDTYESTKVNRPMVWFFVGFILLTILIFIYKKSLAR
ncbi:MAG: CHAT domain-containing protein [Bacteroidetes bacterium]|nr:CHAT domain-containing protein [Bacteroidota bacterium]